MDSHGSYDCITAMAVLHHVRVEEIVEKAVRALRTGGILLIMDVITRPGWRNLPLNAIASGTAPLRNLMLSRPVLPWSDLRKAWREHGSGETYLTIGEARELFENLLPGARVR